MQLRDKIKDLQNVFKIVSKLKSQIIGELPHYGYDALFLKNDVHNNWFIEQYY